MAKDKVINPTNINKIAMNIIEVIDELSKLKTYNEVKIHLESKLKFKLVRYGDLDNNSTAQATFVKDKLVLWVVYRWVKTGHDSYVSGDLVKITYHENE